MARRVHKKSVRKRKNPSKSRRGAENMRGPTRRRQRTRRVTKKRGGMKMWNAMVPRALQTEQHLGSQAARSRVMPQAASAARSRVMPPASAASAARSRVMTEAPGVAMRRREDLQAQRGTVAQPSIVNLQQGTVARPIVGETQWEPEPAPIAEGLESAGATITNPSATDEESGGLPTITYPTDEETDEETLADISAKKAKFLLELNAFTSFFLHKRYHVNVGVPAKNHYHSGNVVMIGNPNNRFSSKNDTDTSDKLTKYNKAAHAYNNVAAQALDTDTHGEIQNRLQTQRNIKVPPEFIDLFKEDQPAPIFCNQVELISFDVRGYNLDGSHWRYHTIIYGVSNESESGTTHGTYSVHLRWSHMEQFSKALSVKFPDMDHSRKDVGARDLPPPMPKIANKKLPMFSTDPKSSSPRMGKRRAEIQDFWDNLTKWIDDPAVRWTRENIFGSEPMMKLISLSNPTFTEHVH